WHISRVSSRLTACDPRQPHGGSARNGRLLTPSSQRTRAAWRLFEAARAELVFVSTCQVTELVKERDAHLPLELGPRRHGPSQVFPIEDNALPVARPGTPAAEEPEDRRWKRRIDREQIGELGQVGRLDLHAADQAPRRRVELLDGAVDERAKLL